MTLNQLIKYCKKNKISFNSELCLGLSDSFVLQGFEFTKGVIKGENIEWDSESKKQTNIIAFTNKRPTHKP
jgi:hypothetical protein